jgi:acyl carrier protein
MNVNEELHNWVRQHIGKLLGIAPESVSLDAKLSDYGLDSVDAVLMAGEIEDHFDIEINPASFIRFPTFEEMIAGLVSALEDREPGCKIP